MDASKERTPNVPLSSIKDVPIHMFVGQSDTICSPEDALWTKNQLTSLKHSKLLHYTEIEGNHFQFVNSQDLSYFSKVLSVLAANKPQKQQWSLYSALFG